MVVGSQGYHFLPAGGLLAGGNILNCACRLRLRQPHSRIMFFDSPAKHTRIRVGDIHDFRSQAIACNLANLNDAGEPCVLGNLKINAHSIADIHGRSRPEA
jgi:hypothetical protein